MLGLGNSISASDYSGGWTPASLSNLTLWLAFNQNMTADQDASNVSISHSIAAGDMADGDKINAWNAFGDTSINAVQTTQNDKPFWETDTADIGGVSFNGSKLLELSEDVVLDANTDFTIAVRIKSNNFDSPRGLMGSAATEFIRVTDNTTFRMKINNVNRDFALASGNMATDEYFTLIIVRSDGSTGNLNVFIRGNESLDGTATGTQVGGEIADPTEITISDIGVTSDEAGNFQGFFKDVIIWDGSAAAKDTRKEIFDYIEGQ